MAEPNEPITPEELEEQESELLPDREVMSLVNPMAPPVGEEDLLYPLDPPPKGVA